MKILIKNGTLVNPAKGQNEKYDLLIEDKYVKKIDKNIIDEDAKVYDATGCFVTPGLIDMHVHLREPGQEAKEDIYSGTQAAAAGGFTQVATMANTSPVIDNAALVKEVLKRTQESACVKVHVIGAVSKNLEGKQLSEIGDMVDAGAVAFSDDGSYIQNSDFMRRAMEYVNMFDKMIIDHAEDKTMSEHGFMNEGEVSYSLGITGRPAVAESIAVARDILLSEMTGCHVHIAHVSSKKAMEMIKEAKNKGLPVTCEATPQHLYFTDEYLKNFESAFKMAPPIRTDEDRKALIEGIKDGTVDAIITDHAPHTSEEKDVPFKCAPNGIAGLETSLSSILTTLYHTKEITIDKVIEIMSVNPAKLLKIEGGILEEGKIADITVIDPNYKWTVFGENLYTKATFTPYEGIELKGKAILTIVDGKVVMEKGKVSI